MSKGNPPDASDTIINFYDNYMPSLTDGQFTITLSQTISQTTTGIPDTPQDPVSQTFLVNGPRFAIPPADVNHVFPHKGSTGIFDTYLPQIVLEEKALPWERLLALSPAQPKIPWMALLVFSGDELPVPTPPPPAGSRKNPTRVTNRLLNDVVVSTYNGHSTTGPSTGILGPHLHKLEVNEDPSKVHCKTIDIPVAVFNQLAPSLNDAQFLAHTREVSLANKATVKGKTGFFSAVIANRFAVPPTAPAIVNTNIAHLVSLEGFESYLKQDGPPNVTGFNTVRMISLQSWTFNVQADPAESFAELMSHLITPESIQGTELLLRMPNLDSVATSGEDADTSSTVKTRLTDGYVPLSYEILSGDQTFAWYRGPLSPVPVTRFLETEATPTGNKA
ncbi:MAG: hypothetical protein AAFN81_24220, partial [Bacteroidota bacterium]